MNVAYCSNCGLERPVEPFQTMGTCYHCGPRMKMQSTRPEKVDWAEVKAELTARGCMRIRIRS